MSGLSDLLKKFGEMKIQGEMWVWDYVKDKGIKKSDMTKEEWCASERVKWGNISKEYITESSIKN